MQLKQVLAAKGYSVRQFWDVMTKDYLLTYQQVARFCRCNNRTKGDPLIWKWIDEKLAELEVNWIEG